MSVQLAKYGPGVVSDAHPALISLYQSVSNGWEPPETLSEEEYKAARLLPDTDPLKAFAGFGCSFGGKYFGGYARNDIKRNYAQAARNSLIRDIKILMNAGCTIENASSFFDRAPESGWTLYLDPPYEGTTGYKGTVTFDHALFWQRAKEWVNAGSHVWVSEYNTPPVEHEIVWLKQVHSTVRKPCGARGAREVRVEKLFKIK